MGTAYAGDSGTQKDINKTHSNTLLEAKVTENSARDKPQSSTSANPEYLKYQELVRKKIAKAWSWSVSENIDTEVSSSSRIAVMIDENGEVVSTLWNQRSNDSLFDASCVTAIMKASPFPSPPSHIATECYNKGVTIEFKKSGICEVVSNEASESADLAHPIKGSLWEKEYLKYPNDPASINNLGVRYMDNGDLIRAQELFEKALTINPNFYPTLMNISILFDKKGDKAKSIEYYKKYIKIHGNDSIERNISLCQSLSMEYSSHMIQAEKCREAVRRGGVCQSSLGYSASMANAKRAYARMIDLGCNVSEH